MPDGSNNLRQVFVKNANIQLDVLYNIAQGIIVNPDPNVNNNREKGLKIYAEMLTDPRISGSINERINSVLAMDFSIEYPDGIVANDIITQFLQKSILNNSNFEKWVRQFLNCLAFGSSYEFPVIDPKTWLLTDLADIPANIVRWDDNNDLRILTEKDRIKGEVFDKNSVIITQIGSPPYGQSILLPVFWYWGFKKIFLENLTLFGGMSASDMTLFLMGENVSILDEDLDTVLKDLLKINPGSNAVIPSFIKEVKRVSSNANNVGSFYNEGIAYFDDEITKAIIGQTASSQDAKGSLGGQQVGQAETKNQISLSDAKLIESALNDLIKLYLPLHFNISEDQFPYISIKPISNIDKAAKLNEFKELYDRGVGFDKEEVYNIFEWTNPIDSQDIIQKTNNPPVNPFGETALQFSDTQSKNSANSDIVQLANPQTAEGLRTKLLNRSIKTDEFLQSNINKTIRQVKDAYGEIVKYYTNEAKKIGNTEDELTDETGDKLKSIVIPVKLQNKINSLFSSAIVTFDFAGYYFMVQRAKQEAKAIRLAEDYLTDEIVFDSIDDFDFISPEMAWARLTQTIPIINDPAIGERIVTTAKLDGLKIGSDSTGFVSNFWGKQIDEAISKGLTIKQFQNSIPQILESAGISGVKPYHIEAIYRTNMSDAFNSGKHMAVIEDDFTSEIFQDVMYSAVGDDRTRPDHEAMNGAIIRVGSPEYDMWLPPNGYNCRCIYEYISKFEKEESGLKNTNISDITVKDRKGNEIPVSPDRGFEGMSVMAGVAERQGV